MNIFIDFKKGDYCILYSDKKGYYLSKIKIAQSLQKKIIDRGEKGYCENEIKRLNAELEKESQ